MNNTIIEKKFYTIKKILESKCEISKEIMKKILQKYPVTIDKVIIETANNLIKNTNLYWEPLRKIEYFTGTEIREYPSVSNYYFLKLPHYSPTYEKSTYGNRESKMIRCANQNKYFIITQKLNNKVPKRTETLNGNNYETINIVDFFNFVITQENQEDISQLSEISSPFSFYDFDSYKIKTIDNEVDLNLVYENFSEAFRNLYADTIDIILNEFQEEIKKCIEKTKLMLIAYNEKITEINNKINENNEYLNRIKFPSIEDFNKFVLNFKDDDKVKNNILYLPDFEDIIKKINEFHSKENEFIESKEFNKDAFRIQTNDNGDIGWYWILKFYFAIEENLPFKGEGNFFVKLNPELFDIIQKVKDIIKKIRFKYIEDPNYIEEYYESTDYASNLPKMYFRTYKSGTLIPLYDNKEITFEELDRILEKIENSAKEIFDYKSRIDINDPEVIDFMYDKIKKGYYKSIDDEELEKIIKEKMKEEKYWNNISYSYSSFEFDYFYCRVKDFINEIKRLIKHANKNKEKGEFFKKYSERCMELFKGYTTYTNNILLSNEKNNIIETINKYEEQLKRLNYSYSLISAIGTSNYQKKKD